jgi:hypothetical protein
MQELQIGGTGAPRRTIGELRQPRLAPATVLPPWRIHFGAGANHPASFATEAGGDITARATL